MCIPELTVNLQDGHLFTCTNPAARTTAFHIVLVMDRSSSMRLSDRTPLQGTPYERILRTKHNNRLGCVYKACYRYIEQRRAVANGHPAAPKDAVSMILFDENPFLVFENSSLMDPSSLLNTMVQYSTSYGTNFDPALELAGEVLIRNADRSRFVDHSPLHSSLVH